MDNVIGNRSENQPAHITVDMFADDKQSILSAICKLTDGFAGTPHLDEGSNFHASFGKPYLLLCDEFCRLRPGMFLYLFDTLLRKTAAG